MPLYEYGCESCGHRLEIQQKLADAPLKTCPSCGKDALEKILSATAFVLKGSGWYKDGYSGGDKPKRTEKQVTDRLQKAVNDDKKKTESAPAASSSSSSSSTAPAGGSSSGSSGGGDKGTSAHVA
jgi:putative FmdB family regulatory protein